MPENTLFTYRTEEDGAVLYSPDHFLWKQDHKTTIDRFLTGGSPIAEKGHGWTNLTQVSSLWNRSALYFYFECWYSCAFQSGAGNGKDSPGTLEAEMAAVLLRPEESDDYFEIMVDSYGRQSAVHVVQPPQVIDQEWEAAADSRVLNSTAEKIWRAFLRLPYEPMTCAGRLTRQPDVGDAWRLNLQRVAGSGADREFLSWRPYNPDKPDLSVFGHLVFLEAR
jgi:hypothetical protein